MKKLIIALAIVVSLVVSPALPVRAESNERSQQRYAVLMACIERYYAIYPPPRSEDLVRQIVLHCNDYANLKVPYIHGR